MDRIKFGQTDLSVSPIGLGCMSMSGCYGAQDDDECLATLNRAFELGVNFLDTSYNYGAGHNQGLIAQVIKGRRDEVVIHSKMGTTRTADGLAVSGTAEHIRMTTEASLKRLEIECLDVICISRVDANVPIEDTVGAMAQMVTEGKTRHIALSKDASPELIQRALAVHPIASLQDEYSLFVRKPEAGLVQECESQGMAFMAFAPLGRGILAGLFHGDADIPEDDRRRDDPRYQGGNLDRNVSLLGGLEAIAADKGISVATLALAWIMHRPGTVIPIPSSKSRGHLDENMAAAGVKLTPEDLTRIETACPAGAAAGVDESLLTRA